MPDDRDNNVELFRKEMLDDALNYIRPNNQLHTTPCSIFPVRFIGKKKFSWSSKKANGNNWGHTADRQQVRTNWTRWPYAGIGLPTGDPNEVFALDADTQEGGHKHDGISALLQLERDHGPFDTHRAKSPTGSEHLYFQKPSGIYIPSRELMPGIDVKGDGGFIVLPPTIRPDKGPYRWLDNFPVSEAPDWLIAMVIAERPTDSADEQIEELDQELLDLCAQDAGCGVSNNPDDLVRPKSPEDMKFKIEVALSVIPSDDYLLWIKIGAAIADGLGDAGFAVFDDWSSGSAKYNKNECKRKWKEIRGLRRIHVAKIFAIADEYDRGWRDFYWKAVRGEVRL